jgi:hypothetical protein
VHYLILTLSLLLSVAGMIVIIVALERAELSHWNTSNLTLGAHTIIGWLLIFVSFLVAALGVMYEYVCIWW